MINGLITSISSFSIAKGSWSFYIIILLPLFNACVNDMKDIERIANIQEEEAVDISKNVTVIYSDSAQVKAELQAPEMRTFHDTTGNYEFTKGEIGRASCREREYKT